ncbi:hypothetical protein CFOL_v3_06841 [Cephalotus follicularis]|uniref:Uncharacterized protein n=1 Tax=Cephalotus follicularis TaxID=3775 RepID=A0A1Q3B6B3_CEPFO|nr:hypothetical protein CFOL_v3_06841 [Cephalotus follicularis]
MTSSHAVHFCQSYVEEYRLVGNQGEFDRRCCHKAWRTIMAGDVRLNCDAVVYSDGSCSGVERVLRDCDELVLDAGTRRFVQAWAICYGLLCGKRLGFHCLVVESDA